jgi:hypothetical protein
MGRFGLSDWDEVEAEHKWPILLAGNGASQAVSNKFAYYSLFAEAELSGADRGLFAKLDTTNFEDVLRSLDISQVVCEQLGHDYREVQNRYETVRGVLVETVNRHHVSWSDVQDRLTVIKTALRKFQVVYSTSYDLLFYWAINFEGPSGFADRFWGPDHHFDSVSDVWNNYTAVYWLHGGLHIYRTVLDSTAKRVNEGADLLAQFAEGGHLPLYVAEGTADKKRSSIRRSDYLAYCLEALASDDRAIVVFGQALGPSDAHIVDAIRHRRGRRVAYGVYADSQAQADFVCADMTLRLLGCQVLFFDSTTHPLGMGANQQTA